jgi:type IV secretory pathway TrbD component
MQSFGAIPRLWLLSQTTVLILERSGIAYQTTLRCSHPTMALTAGATIAVVIFGCAALCLCGYAIWAVMFADKANKIDNTRPQGEQAQYMREIRRTNLRAFARDFGRQEQRLPSWSSKNVSVCS